MLLVLLLATLPGPQVTTAPGQSQQLATAKLALTAFQGRDLFARKDAMQIRPLAATALPPSDLAPPPPRIARSLVFVDQPRAGVCAGKFAPCARAPPFLRMTA